MSRQNIVQVPVTKKSLKMKILILCLISAFIIDSVSGVLTSSILKEKIIHGEPVNVGAMKFMASLRIRLIHFCGGCLISKVHILTAGSCIDFIKTHGGENYYKTTILLGTIEFFGIGLVRSVKDLEHHDLYKPDNKPETSAFDIGVILLNEAIQNMGSVSEIPFSDLEAKFNVLGDVVGWGTRGIGSQDIPLDHITMSRVLQKMPIRITHEKACQHLYEHFKVDVKKQGCAYGLRDEATSRGDIGNALVVENKLMGIVIDVTTSTPAMLPTLFIKVSEFNDYIKKAKIRFIDKYQGVYARKRVHEGCLEDNSKRKIFHNFF